ARTLAAIAMAGYSIDHELWLEASAECSQCHAGCSDSPNTGKKGPNPCKTPPRPPPSSPCSAR
ncbi:hypothetical protein CLM85_22960, partial [Streptomyces albidoflavus]